MNINARFPSRFFLITFMWSWIIWTLLFGILITVLRNDKSVNQLQDGIYQNGAVVRLGEKYGVDTPVNRFVYYTILPMDIKARRK